MPSPLPNIVQKFNQTPWMILRPKFDEISSVVERYALNTKLSEKEISLLIEASSFNSDNSRRPDGSTKPTGVSVVSVVDTLMNRADLFSQISGATSYQSIVSQIDEAALEVDDIVLDLDTPGGSVNGVYAVVDAINRFRSKSRIHATSETGDNKRVFAAVNDMAASAGYLIACNCDKIVVSPGSTVGSIGVVMVHMDYSGQDKKKRIVKTVIASGEDKAVGNPHQPLTEEDRKKLKAEVDNIADIFVSSVSAGRGMSIEDVKALATGKTFRGEEAISLGLADELGSLTSVIESIIQDQLAMPNSNKPSGQQKSSAAASQQATEPQAGNDLAALQATVEQLTGVVGTLAAGFKAQQEQMLVNAKQESVAKATALVNNAIRAGKIQPSQGPAMIEQATENYDLVENILGAMNAKRAVPNLTGNPFGAPPQENRQIGTEASLPEDAANIFRQLGLLDHNGEITMQRVTLPINEEGQSDHLGAENLVNVMPDRSFIERQPATQAMLEGLSFLTVL